MNASLRRLRPVPPSCVVRDGLRIEVETVRGLAVHVRLSGCAPSTGITTGPAATLSLSLADARDLAGLLERHAAGRPEDLTLPIEAPRADWPALLDHAAHALQGRRIVNTESLAIELRAIAEAIRLESHA